jgi:hypothetical protein
MENLELIKDLELEEFERELNEIDTTENNIQVNETIEHIQEEVKTENENNIQVNETIEHIPEIETIEPLEEVNINTLIQPEQQPKKRGRPKKITNPEEPKIIKKYYVKTGIKPTGRPKTTKPIEEVKKNHNKLIKEYYYRRGKHVSKLSYYAKNYNIPTELKEMKTETFEDLEKKLCRYIDYVNQFKIEVNKMKLNEKINISKCNKGVLELKRELRENQREIIEM